MTKRILVIIQRSNGDVLLSLPLINTLFEFFDSPEIDLLVNDDTYPIAKLLPNIKSIYEFSYQKKQNYRYKQEKKIIKQIFRKYDLSINLTSSDRSVIYALLASKKSISAVEKTFKKSWWKKLFLTNYYYFDFNKHILKNNLQPLNYLGIKHSKVMPSLKVSKAAMEKVKKNLKERNIYEFLIFHPSAQYQYKIYPQYYRHKLLQKLSTLNVTILVTGSSNEIDSEIKYNLQSIPNIIDLIGETTLEEYVALSELSKGYIGMDTLNMHIAAMQNKRIFAIFGPTITSMWSPWSRDLNKASSKNTPLQKYGNITIFQANMECVACGKAGCNNSGTSICLDNINPNSVFEEVSNWVSNPQI